MFPSHPGSGLKTGWSHFWACTTQPCQKLFHSLASLSLSLNSPGASFLPCDVISQYFPSVPQVLRGPETTTSLRLLRNPSALLPFPESWVRQCWLQGLLSACQGLSNYLAETRSQAGISTHRGQRINKALRKLQNSLAGWAPETQNSRPCSPTP